MVSIEVWILQFSLQITPESSKLTLSRPPSGIDKIDWTVHGQIKTTLFDRSNPADSLSEIRAP
jgi:hypothetical protein